MPLPSRLLFTVRIFQSSLAIAQLYFLTSTLRSHLQSNPLTILNGWLFAISYTVSFLSLPIPIRDIQKHLTRRSRHRKYGSLGSIDTDPASNARPRFRMVYEQVMLGLWLASALLMLLALDVEIWGTMGVAYVELLLFATSSCLVERDVHRIMLSGAPMVKARSVSAGDVVFPSSEV